MPVFERDTRFFDFLISRTLTLNMREIAQAHGLRARTCDQLAAAVRRAGGYITVTRNGRPCVFVAQ